MSFSIRGMLGASGSVKRGALHSVVAGMANKVITAIGQIALAWFLVPKDIGLVALAASISSFGQIFLSVGIKDVLVQRGGCAYDNSRSIISIGLFMNCVAALGLAVLAPFLSRMYGDSRIVGLIYVTALSWPVAALYNPYAAELTRRLKFSVLSWLQFFEGVIYTGSSILLARAGFGAMSLVLPLLWKSVPTVVMSFPTIRSNMFYFPSLVEWSGVIVPAVYLSLAGLTQAVQSNIVNYVAGYFGKVEMVGLYSWGYQMASQAIFLVAINLRQVLFPAFRRDIDSAENGVKGRVSRIATLMSIVVCAICVIQCLLADIVVRSVFKSVWWPGIPVIRWLSVALLGIGFEVVGTAILMARGEFNTITALRIVSIIMIGLSAAAACITSNGADLLAAYVVLPTIASSLLYYYFGFVRWKV